MRARSSSIWDSFPSFRSLIFWSLSNPGIVTNFRDDLCEMLGDRVDLLFCDRCESLTWSRTDNLDIAMNSLKKIARTFVITLGDEGAFAYDGTHLHTIAPHRVQAVNTNGAGDTFAGAFLFGIAQGKDFPTAGRLASLAASVVVSDRGSRLTAKQQQHILAEHNVMG